MSIMNDIIIKKISTNMIDYIEIDGNLNIELKKMNFPSFALVDNKNHCFSLIFQGKTMILFWYSMYVT